MYKQHFSSFIYPDQEKMLHVLEPVYRYEFQKPSTFFKQKKQQIFVKADTATNPLVKDSFG
jgi:hypothetical protein